MPRRRPYNDAHIAAVCRLLKAGSHSLREISRLVGLTRWSVALIAKDHPRRVERCPGCGGKLVQRPCVLCRTRQGTAWPGTAAKAR